MSRPEEITPSATIGIGETPRARMKRVEEIRERVAAGSYEVPAKDVADALVAFFRRDFPPDDPR